MRKRLQLLFVGIGILCSGCSLLLRVTEKARFAAYATADVFALVLAGFCFGLVVSMIAQAFFAKVEAA